MWDLWISGMREGPHLIIILFRVTRVWVMRHNNLIGTRHSIMSGHCLAPGNKGLINIYLCIIMRGKESLKVTGPCYYHHSNKKCFISAFVGCQICQNSLNATLIQQVLSVFTMKLKHCELCSWSPGAGASLIFLLWARHGGSPEKWAERK